MKRKITFLTLTFILLFVGVVSASSLWGTYKGNQIIRLTVNGDPIRVNDVPAISYNNRTMIPIYLLNQAGINYSWDQKNQTVDIQKNNDSNLSSNKDSIRIASLYKNLEDLGELIIAVKDSYDLSMINMMLGNDTSINTSNQKLSGAITQYNSFLNRSDVNQYSLSNPQISQILNNYYEAIEKLKEMDTFIRTTSMTSRTLQNDYKYLTDSASSLIYNGINLSDQNFGTSIYEAIK